MKARMLGLALFLVASVVSLAGAGENIKIGYCDNNFNDTFHTFMLDAANEYAAKNGIELAVMDAMLDSVRQQDGVRNMINDGVQALIVIPNDTSAVGPMTEAAQEAGIPIIYLNLDPFSDGNVPEGAYYVGSPTKEGGIMQMEYIGERMGGKGAICVLMGLLTNEATYSRTDGVVEVVEQQYPDIQILSQETGLWQRDQAVSVMENWITAYGDQISAVIANNDEMALGASHALRSAGMGHVFTAGIDGTPDALQAIQNGTLTVSVLQDAIGQGRGAVELAHKLVQGESSEPVIWVPLALITKENVHEFMNR
ncbi:MAG: substrate-binding domain-containing protein [Planctomycetaceae bacterium]|nr:substrate-binding domain-containing protein [Planctomycetaceae bacterium]